jgi:hypothetical protein
MKIKLIFILIALFTGSAFAQNSAVEKNFEKNKKSYFLTKFSIGEDASSGSDYLVYRQKTSTKKIRVIWSNYERATVDDYYYEFGKPVLLVKYSAKKSQYKSLAKGTNLPLKVEEKLSLSNGKLVAWIEKGKTVSSTDSRWAEKEKEILESFEEQLETFRSHLRGEL